MVTPRVPSIDFDFEATPVAPPFVTDDVIFMIGEAGTGADAKFTDEYVSPELGNLQAVLDIVGTDGKLAQAASAIFSRASATVYVTPVKEDTTTMKVLNKDVAEAAQRALNTTRKPTIVMAPGLTSGPATDANETDDTSANAVVTALATVAETLNCQAFVDAASGSAANAIAWSNNNRAARVRMCANWVGTSGNYQAPSPHVVGAILEATGEFGRQYGINLFQVHSANSLELNVSYSVRAGVTTDVSRMVAGFLTVLVRRNGRTIIVGDEGPGYADSRRYVSNARVYDALERLLEDRSEIWIGTRITELALNRIASDFENVGRASFVANGELVSLVVTPSMENNATTRRQRTAIFDIDAEPVISANHIRNTIRPVLG